MALVFGVAFVFGTSAYMLEHPHNPSFSSISDGLWWAFITLTTVGYGDVVPVTEVGRIIAALTMAFGISVYSLLIANLTHFLETRELKPVNEKNPSIQALICFLR